MQWKGEREGRMHDVTANSEFASACRGVVCLLTIKRMSVGNPVLFGHTNSISQ